MISKQLVNYVHKEAAKLKANAAPEELGNLDFERLSPLHVNQCIYGEMTGHCESQRALELLSKCASIGLVA